MHNKTIDQIILERGGRTNINNINYNNNTINDLMTLTNALSDATFTNPMVPIGIASREDTSSSERPKGEDYVSGKDTLATKESPWQMLKIDLFNNATDKDLVKNKTKYKIAISALDSETKDWIYLRASMNGPFRNLKRGLDSEEWNDLKHYQNLRNLYTELKENSEYSTVMASKCYDKGKKGTIHEVSMIIALNIPSDKWEAFFLFHEEIHLVTLSGLGLTDAQRRANIVGTGSIGNVPDRKKRSGRDLFGKSK